MKSASKSKTVNTFAKTNGSLTYLWLKQDYDFNHFLPQFVVDSSLTHLWLKQDCDLIRIFSNKNPHCTYSVQWGFLFEVRKRRALDKLG